MTEIKPSYVWPATLKVPPRPPKLVYLDLNQWIGLAKADTGHKGGAALRQALDDCLDAVEQGLAVFPISDSIYGEISKIGRHRQRRDLREVIERISHYIVVPCRSIVSAHEIESLVDRVLGRSPKPINVMSYLDWGVARAFGVVGGFRVKSREGKDVTEEVRLKYPLGPEAFDRELARAELELNRRVIEGPTAEEEPELRRYGWNPASSIAVNERRAEQEIDLVGRLDADPKWRRGRIRDVVAARELTIELLDPFREALSDRGATVETFFARSQDSPRILDAMPSFDVAVSLKASYHRDPNHRWTTNDIHDIDALGSTLPYCDIVVTDKAVASHVERTGLAERLQTTVLSRITDVFERL